MKINVNNSTMDLWQNFMNAKTEDEKRKALRENLEKIKLNYDIININDEEQKNPGELDDSELTPKARAIKEVVKKLKARALAERIAKGQHLTSKEMKYLKKTSPELLAKAKIADRQRKMLESRIKNVRTKREAQDIIFFTRGLNISMSNSASGEDGKELSLILNEAVKQAEKNTKKEVIKKERKEEEEKRKKHINKLV